MVRLVILRLLESYFRHPLLFLLPVGLMAVAAALSVLLATPEYGARGTMFVEDKSLLASLTGTASDFSWRRTAAQNVVGDFQDLLRTDAFVRSAIQRTSLESRMAEGPEVVEQVFDYFRQSVSVSAIGGKLVQFSAWTDDPVLSQQLVVASMDSYVFWKINADYQESIVAQNFFAGLIPTYEQELQAARDELSIFLATYPEPIRGERPLEEEVELRRLTLAVDDANRHLEEARTNEENARLALAKAEKIAFQTFQVLDAPELPDAKEIPLRNIAIQIVIFLAVGVVLSVICVIGATLLDRTLRFPLDVRQGLSLPVLGIVAAVRPDDVSAALNQQQPAAKPSQAPVIPQTSPQLLAAQEPGK